MTLSQTGCIRWPRPEEKYKDTGEGGMWVYAVVPTHKKDWFEKCCVDYPTFNLPNAGPLSNSKSEGWVDLKTGEQKWPLRWKWWPGEREWDKQSEAWSEWKYTKNEQGKEPRKDEWLTRSRSLLAAVCLGSTNASWWREDNKGYFVCERKHLTLDGRMLVRALERLYKRKVTLLTFLDT